MGDPGRLRPKYETPRAVWNAERIAEESKLKSEYGLKNIREVWIAQRETKRMRREARKLLALGETGAGEAAQVIAKCIRLGFVKEGATLETLLGLSVRDVLERRLETRVQKRGLAKSIAQARQLVAHGFICVRGAKMTSPGYIVPVLEDSAISYYKPIDLSAPVMAQKSGRAREAAAAMPAEPAAEAAGAPAAEASAPEAAAEGEKTEG